MLTGIITSAIAKTNPREGLPPNLGREQYRARIDKTLLIVSIRPVVLILHRKELVRSDHELHHLIISVLLLPGKGHHPAAAATILEAQALQEGVHRQATMPLPDQILRVEGVPVLLIAVPEVPLLHGVDGVVKTGKYTK